MCRTSRPGVVLAVLVLAGCGGGGRSAADVARARVAVAAALESWKANEPAAKLKALAEPVEFPEELRATHTLTEFALGKADGADPDVIRVWVTLSLKDKKGKATEREAVYAVKLASPVAVSRDPFY